MLFCSAPLSSIVSDTIHVSYCYVIEDCGTYRRLLLECLLDVLAYLIIDDMFVRQGEVEHDAGRCRWRDLNKAETDRRA